MPPELQTLLTQVKHFLSFVLTARRLSNFFTGQHKKYGYRPIVEQS
jgi:hypothetical protein